MRIQGVPTEHAVQGVPTEHAVLGREARADRYTVGARASASGGGETIIVQETNIAVVRFFELIAFVSVFSFLT